MDNSLLEKLKKNITKDYRVRLANGGYVIERKVKVLMLSAWTPLDDLGNSVEDYPASIKYYSDCSAGLKNANSAMESFIKSDTTIAYARQIDAWKLKSK